MAEEIPVVEHAEARPLSERLIELANPYLEHLVQDKAHYDGIFLIAGLAWNLSVLGDDLVASLPELQRHQRKTAPQAELIDAMIARKRGLFPHDRRLAVDVKVREVEGEGMTPTCRRRARRRSIGELRAR